MSKGETMSKKAYMMCLCGWLVGPKKSYSFMECPNCGFTFHHSDHEWLTEEEANELNGKRPPRLEKEKCRE